MPDGSGPGNLADRAYERLEEMIVTQVLEAGATVSGNRLARRLGMSRTPVRAALQRLAREGLVRVLPRRGLLVAGIDADKQLRMLEVRREIDRLLARCAAERRTDGEAAAFNGVAGAFDAAGAAADGDAFTRADRTFNRLLAEAARNEFAAEAAMLTQGHARRFWYVHRRRHSSVPEAARLHAAVARAVAAAEAAAAAAASDALLDHVERFTRAVRDSGDDGGR